MNWLLRRLLALWVRFTVRPDDAALACAAAAIPICYVLERRSITDLAVLQNACVRLKMPRPQKRLLPRVKRSALVLLSHPAARVLGRAARPPAARSRWCSMIAALRAHPEPRHRSRARRGVLGPRAAEGRLVVPPAARRGLGADQPRCANSSRCCSTARNADRDRRADLAAQPARRRRGRRRAGAPGRARPARLLRSQRAARIGPDLSHRRTIVARVLRTRAVRAAVAQEMREKKITAPPGAAAGAASTPTRSPLTTRTRSCASWSIC